MKIIRTKQRPRRPQLSVLIPFYKDDPRATVLAMATMANPKVEILAWDDGTNDAAVTDAIETTLSKQNANISVFVCPENQGRSAARNALFDEAKGDWVLFLDADMQPGDGNFLARYLEAIESDAGDVFFGGFIVEETGSGETALHRELSRASDCANASARAEHGPQHVASSNLCVRRDVLITEPFDAAFTGWGWEDSEWAARVAKSYRVVHLDNPAVHLGLETDDTLLSRFATSGPNYARFTQKHPEFAQELPLFRHATRLARTPGQSVMRPFLKLGVKASFLPVRARILALKLWRASHYAQALKSGVRS